MRVWDARTGQRLYNLPHRPGYVDSIVFSPDGTRILMPSMDQTPEGKLMYTARVYLCEECQPLTQLLKLAQRHVTRELTVDERVRYLPQTTPSALYRSVH